jgi:hypothetical protein
MGTAETVKIGSQVRMFPGGVKWTIQDALQVGGSLYFELGREGSEVTTFDSATSVLEALRTVRQD